MKAIVSTKYGSPDVLEFREIARPTPNDDEVLIKIYAASTNAADWHFLRGTPLFLRLFSGLRKPKNNILGTDVAGKVEAVGKNVTQFLPGDNVFAKLSAGGFAEYACAPANMVVSKPSNLNFEEAAAVPLASMTALQGLRDVGQIQSGQKVLIYGASGGVGTFAVQIAKAFGAEVTAVCSTKKVEITHTLGADHVIDYTKEDFTENGQKFDLILLVNGDRSLSDYERALTPTGTFVMAGGSMSLMFKAIFWDLIKSKSGGKTMKNFTAKSSQEDLIFMKDLIERGKVKPLIDRCFPLSATPDAIHYLEAGHAKGKIVINMVNSTPIESVAEVKNERH